MLYKWILISSFLLSPVVLADSVDEMNEWYLAKNGKYLIRDTINEDYFAELAPNQVGELNVYLQFWDKEYCVEASGKVKGHDPLYVNSKLVKYQQACDGEWRTFFPATKAGREYIVSEFKKKNLVEITTYQKDFKVLFSATGFSKIYNKLKVQSEAI